MSRKKQTETAPEPVIEPGPPAADTPEPADPVTDTTPGTGQITLAGMPVSEPPPGHGPAELNPSDGVTEPKPVRKRNRRTKAQLEAERATQQPLAPVQAGPSESTKAMAAACAEMLSGAWSTACVSYPDDVQAVVARMNTELKPKREQVLLAPMAYVETELGPNGVLVVSMIALVGMELAMYATLQRALAPYKEQPYEPVDETAV